MYCQLLSKMENDDDAAGCVDENADADAVSRTM